MRISDWSSTCALPILPGLGPLMLTVGAVQMFNEAFEGIEAFERGETREMWAHFSSVALNTAFVATGAAVLPHIQWPSTVEQLEPVQLANGDSHLWRPDLKRSEERRVGKEGVST